MDASTLLTAFAGGMFGAALGASIVFIVGGGALLAGIVVAMAGGGSGLLAVANGPFLGLNVSFAGGVAAAAYAARRGCPPEGQDAGNQPAGVAVAGPLVVGGAFGVAGQLIITAAGPTLSGHTNGVALTVFCLNAFARLAFGCTGLFGRTPPGAGIRARWAPPDSAPLYSLLACIAVIGTAVGLPAGFATLFLARTHPELGAAVTGVGFALSALSMISTVAGRAIPATHHMTLTAATATYLSGSVVAGAVVGGLAGVAGELWDRTFQNHSDSLIDPPASTIWSVTAAIYAVQALS